MTSRKGKAHEEVQAAAGSKAGAAAGEAAGGSAELGAVREDAAAGADGDAGQSTGELSDANAAAGDAPALPGADGGVSDGPDQVLESADHEGLSGGPAVLAGEGSGSDGGNPSDDGGAAPDGDRLGAGVFSDGDGENAGADDPIDFGDMNLDAAVEVYQAQLLAGAMLIASAADDANDPAIAAVLDDQVDDTAYASMAAFVRRIGRRATPEVLASHLHIEKHRATAEASPAELLAYRGFITTLLDLDDLKTTLEAEAERARARPAPVAPTPIEDTTLEPIDGFFSPTW